MAPKSLNPCILGRDKPNSPGGEGLPVDCFGLSVGIIYQHTSNDSERNTHISQGEK